MPGRGGCQTGVTMDGPLTFRALPGAGLLAALAMVMAPRHAGAQTCSQPLPQPVGSVTLTRFLDETRADIATRDDSRATPSARIEAGQRAAQRLEHLIASFPRCTTLTAQDAVRISAAVGGDDSVRAEERLWAGCVRAISLVHASGPMAADCIGHGFNAGRAMLFALPSIAEEWHRADPDASASIYERWSQVLASRPSDRRLRLAVATARLESADFAGVLETLQDQTDSDALQLRAGADVGLGRVDDAEAALTQLASRSPRAPMPHLFYALVMDWFRSQPPQHDALVRAFRHARAFLCLARSPRDDALINFATSTLASLQEAAFGFSAWNPRGHPVVLPLPLRDLGSEARRRFDPSTPVETDCPVALREVR